MCGSKATVFFRAAFGWLGLVRLRPPQREGRPILNDPLDDFALVEFHGGSERGGEVDVPLPAALTLDELDLGRVSHGGLLVI